MKAVATFAFVLLLSSCATTTSQESGAASDYTAKLLPDGSVELLVTGTTAAPTSSSGASLELGTMLERAAAKECPSGYNLSPDPTPNVRTEAGRLIATLRGIAKCK